MRLLVFYGLLVAPWPGLQKLYGDVFRSAAEFVFSSYGASGLVRFRSAPITARMMDTKIYIENRRTGDWKKADFSTRFTGYLPTAVLTALILATPIPWRRRWKSLLWGLAASQTLIAVSVWMILLYGFSRDSAVSLTRFGPFGESVVTWLHALVTTSVSFTYMAPVLIWIAVAIRGPDIRRWREAAGLGPGR